MHNGYVTGWNVTAAAPLHPIFNGPYTPVGTAWSGNLFAHGYFTNAPGYTTLIVDEAANPVLIEKPLGAGHIILSGATTTNFHGPQLEATNLAKNILHYGASKANCDVVPEPGPIALLIGGGLAGTVLLRRSRKR